MLADLRYSLSLEPTTLFRDLIQMCNLYLMGLFVVVVFLSVVVYKHITLISKLLGARGYFYLIRWRVPVPGTVWS